MTPRLPAADMKVQIVTDADAADARVQVVGDQVLDVAATDAGKLVQVSDDGGLALVMDGSSDLAAPVAGQYASPTRASTATAVKADGNQFFTWLGLAGPAQLDRIGVEVVSGAAGGLVRLGLYADDDGMPGALLVDAGTVACDDAGVMLATIDQAVSAPGVWLSAVRQGAPAPTLRVQADGHYARFTRDTASVVTQFDLSCWSMQAQSGPLADPVPPGLIGDAVPPVIVVRFA